MSASVVSFTSTQEVRSLGAEKKRSWRGFFSSSDLHYIDLTIQRVWSFIVFVLLQVRTLISLAKQQWEDAETSPLARAADILHFCFAFVLSAFVFAGIVLHSFLVPVLVYRIVTEMRKQTEHQAYKDYR